MVRVAKKKKKKNQDTTLGIIAIIILVILAVIIVRYAAVDKAPEEQLEAAALVNGNPITMAELDRQYDLVPASYKSFVTKASILEGLINQKLLLAEAEEQEITVSDEELEAFITDTIASYGLTQEDFEAQVVKSGATMDEVRKSYRDGMIITQLLNESVPVEELTEQELRTYYEANEALFTGLDGEQASFDDVEDQIKVALSSQGRDAQVQTFIESLRQEADIEVMYEEDAPVAIDAEVVIEDDAEEIVSIPEEQPEEPDVEVIADEPQDTTAVGTMEEFVACLTGNKVVLYGVAWSKKTTEQLELFGEDAQGITYVDCDEKEDVCVVQDISNYPTWNINDNLYAGKRSIATLGKLSGCQLTT